MNTFAGWDDLLVSLCHDEDAFRKQLFNATSGANECGVSFVPLITNANYGELLELDAFVCDEVGAYLVFTLDFACSPFLTF